MLETRRFVEFYLQLFLFNNRYVRKHTGQRSPTCFTRALPGENFLLEMAGFPMPIFGVRESTVVGGA